MADQQGVTRKLAAILYADVAGYSKLTGADEEGTHRMVADYLDAISGLVEDHDGRIVHYAGDAVLADFASVVAAAKCAIEIQKELGARNADIPDDRKVQFRIGVNLGDVIVDRDDIYGNGVNVAARLESLADAGGICISRKVLEEVEGKIDIGFDDIGPQEVKNIAKPVQAYRVVLEKPPAVGQPPTLPEKPSIAVLPFQTMAGNTDQHYLTDGIVEAITAALSRIRSFFVIARNSAFTYKDRAINVIDVGRELGVAYVLEGSLQHFGGRIRITVQLVETEAGTHIWAEHYDGTIEEVFDLQDRITENVAGQLQPSIRQAEIDRSRRKRPENLGAYDFTMRAMPHVWALEKEESEKALDLLDKALAIDPDYALALSLAGWCHAQCSVYNWSVDAESSQALAQRLAERAAELSGDDPIILAVLGAVHTFVRNYGTARILLERAVSLDPNAAWAWQRLGWLETYLDRPKQALEYFGRALRLSPFDPMNFNIHVGMGSAKEIAQEHEAAATHFQRALEERPRAVWIYRNLASSLIGAGRVEEAKQAFAILMRNYPDLTVAKVRRAMVFSDSTMDQIMTNLRDLGLPD